MYRLALKSHAGMNCLSILKLLTPDSILSAILYEDSSRLHKTKSDISRYAFLPQSFHPIEITWACSSVVFSSAGDLLDLTAVQILPDTDRIQQRSTVQSFMPERQFQEHRDSLICPALILTGHIKKNIIPV